MPSNTSSSSEHKICTKCGNDKPYSEYHKKKGGKFGLQPKCKACILEYQRARWRDNTEHVKEINARSRQKCGTDYNKKYRAKHGQKWNENRRAKYAVDETYREKCKRYAHEWAETNPDRRAYNFKQWRIANPERLKVYMQRHYEKYHERYRRLWVVQSARRRARKRLVDGSFTTEEWQNLKMAWNYTCLCCGKTEPDIKLSHDHIVPLILGGSNNIDNIQPLCISCNSKKNAKYIDYRNSFVDSNVVVKP